MLERLMKVNKYHEAFTEQHNLIGIALLGGISAATLNPLPLFVGLVAETAYMVLVPDSKWYEARLKEKNDVLARQHLDEMKENIIPTLSDEMRVRFESLEQMRRSIGNQDAADAKWFDEVTKKLDFLLEKYLNFGSKEIQFKNYLKDAARKIKKAAGDDSNLPWEDDSSTRRRKNSIPENDAWIPLAIKSIEDFYESEIQALNTQVQTMQDESTSAILMKRLDVLKRRKDSATKIGKMLDNLSHQIDLIEDTFGLINDEILTHPPDQILASVDEVVSQSNIMSDILEGMSVHQI